MASECSITAKLYRFSDETYHIPGVESNVEFSDDNNDFLREFSLSVYGNGDSPENQGYVSLSIHFRSSDLNQFPLDIASSCLVSVIDSENEERFTRSFHRECKNFSEISFDISKYIARNVLVEEASELLANNCLTIRACIIYQNFTEMIYSEELFEFMSSVKLEEELESSATKFILNLDSVVGRRLYEESIFFKDMIDNTSGKDMEIPIAKNFEEFDLFRELCMIIMGAAILQFYSLDHFCHVYKLADKYGILSAVETCRTLIKSYFKLRMNYVAFHEFSPIEGHLMLRAADMTGDDSLKEITNNFMQRNYAYFEEKGEIVWKCKTNEFIETNGLPGLYIIFTRKDHQEEGLNFYS